MPRKNPPKECETCNGEGYVYSPSGADECPKCNGTGYADKQPRMSCAACGHTFKESNMHVSPDEDGNRTVCEPCMLRMERFYQIPVPKSLRELFPD